MIIQDLAKKINMALTRKVRVAIMLTLVGAFFVIAPLVIFYTAGYRYDWKKGEVKETGVLNIDAQPTDAEVYLNNVKQTKKLPIYLPNRAPGTYHIKIAKPGYKTWEKDITIESKKTTYIKSIVLFKEALPVQILGNYKKTIISLSPAPDGRHLLVVSKQTTGDIYEIDLYNTATKLINSVLRAKLDAPPIITWAPGNNFALVKTVTNKKVNKQIIDVDDPSTTPNFSFPTNLNEIAATNNYTITKNENGLIVAKLENGTVKETKNLPTQNVFYNPQTKEWLTWSPWEIWTIYANGETALLNRTGEKIDFVLPLDNFGILLLASKNKITGFNPGYYVTHELFNDGKIENVGVDISNRKIFFLGEVAGKRGVYELEY